MTIAILRVDLILALAPSLGEEKSAEVVTGALAKLGLDGPALEPPQVDAVLDLLASEPGLVGVAARVAKQRSRVFSDDPNASLTLDSSLRRSLFPRTVDPRMYESSLAVPPSIPPPAPLPGERERVRVRDLVRMLATGIGDSKAEEVIRSVLARKSLDESNLTREAALGILESLAKEPGIVGVTARFAKARMLLD